MIKLFTIVGVIAVPALIYFSTAGRTSQDQKTPKVGQFSYFQSKNVIPKLNKFQELNVKDGFLKIPNQDEMNLASLNKTGKIDKQALAKIHLNKNPSGVRLGRAKTISSNEATPLVNIATAQNIPEPTKNLEFSEDKNAKYDRVINLTLSEWHFSKSKIKVKVGETIRFDLVNKGAMMHEFMFMSVEAMKSFQYRLTRADWNLLEHEATFDRYLILPNDHFIFTVKILGPGTWMYMCVFPHHKEMGMLGKMSTENI